MPVIKKHRNGNRYLLTPSGLWVRDFTRKVAPIDINNFIARTDYRRLRENEIEILSIKIPDIANEHVRKKSKCLIISDGYGFNEKKKILAQIPKDVYVIGTNRSLAKWKDGDDFITRSMNLFIVNNPYRECMNCLPEHQYRPPCLASIRTYPKFLRKYNGPCYYYRPSMEKSLHRKVVIPYTIDDYRNPICAAVGMAYKIGVKKLALFCCDDAFKDERPAAEQLPNGLWMYPQHRAAHELIEGNLHWLNHEEGAVNIKSHSSGP